MSTQETQSGPGRAAAGERPRRIPPAMLWFAVLGGVVAWSIQILVTWAAMELGCVAPIGDELVGQRRGSPGTVTWTIVIAGMAVPWLVAVLAFLACLWVRRRLRSYDEGEGPAPDVLSRSRTSFLVVLGVFLDLMSIAIITGSALALWVVEPCS